MNSTSTLTDSRSVWPLERVLFAMAGTMAILSAVLVALVSPWFLILTAFVGVNQWAYVVLGACPASMVLKRFGLRATCRWSVLTTDGV
jgi:hypothetical protein